GVFGLSLSGLNGGSRSAAATPPASDNSTPPPMIQPMGAMERNDGRLPIGPVPVQALVSLDKDKVVVKTNQPVLQPGQGVDAAGNPVAFYEVIYTLRADRYRRDEVEVYDVHRRKLDTKDLAKLLKKEVAALVLAGTREIDPLHLRLIKDGTLIFVLPLRGGAVSAVVPATPPLPSLPPGTVEVVPGTQIQRYSVRPSGSPPLSPPTQTVPPNEARPPEIRGDQPERQLAIARFYL